MSVDDLRSIERFTQFDYRSVREYRVRTNGQAAICFQPVLAREHQHTLRAERLANGFRNALADPVDVLRCGFVEKRQDQDGVRPSHRLPKQDEAQAVKQKPLHFFFSLAAAPDVRRQESLVRGYDQLHICAPEMDLLNVIFAVAVAVPHRRRGVLAVGGLDLYRGFAHLFALLDHHFLVFQLDA